MSKKPIRKKKEIAPASDSWMDENLPSTAIAYEDVDELEEGFREQLATNPKYSLEIDPGNRYGFSKKESDFIKHMIQYKNVQFVSTVLMDIPVEEGIEIYNKYDVQSEIKRINLALYARRFATKMADLDQIGGYLTSGLKDDNVPVADRWSPKEKLTAAKLLMQLNGMRRKGLESPMIIEGVEIQKDLEKLSPNDLKQLIEYNDEEALAKDKLIEIINEGDLLSFEEIKNLKMMSLEELEDLAEKVAGGEEDGEEDD